MKNQNNLLTKHFLLFISLILLFNCSTNEEKKERYNNINGIYKLKRIYTCRENTNGGLEYGYFETECDKQSLLEIQSNNSSRGTFKVTDYNHNNDEDCSDFEITVGTWEFLSTNLSGSFAGAFTFDNSDEVFEGSTSGLSTPSGDTDADFSFTRTKTINNDIITYFTLWDRITN